MATPSVHESAARHRKAVAIADVIWTAAVKSAESDEHLAETVEQVIGCAESWRVSFARCAGQAAPSEETWAEVASRLRELLDLRRTVQETYEAAHA